MLSFSKIMAEEKQVKNIQNPIQNLDLTNSRRNLWLVKVPKYVAEKLRKAPLNMEVGKLCINNTQQKASLELSQELVNMDQEIAIPIIHTLEVSPMENQKLAVFTHLPFNKNTEDPVHVVPEDLRMEGFITEKLDCRPILDRSYLQMKSQVIKKAAIPKRQAVPIEMMPMR